jgi:hypothetical protein
MNDHPHRGGRRRSDFVHVPKLLPPDTENVIEEFGPISYPSDKNLPKGLHAYGMASMMYDVLNRIAVNSVLGPARADEVDLAVGHLEKTPENDLV